MFPGVMEERMKLVRRMVGAFCQKVVPESVVSAVLISACASTQITHASGYLLCQVSERWTRGKWDNVDVLQSSGDSAHGLGTERR